MKYKALSSKLYIKNRAKFSKLIPKSSLAIFHSNDEMPRNGDAFFKFRQNSDLFYLSGIDQEQTILLLCPNAPIKAYREVLFVRQTNEHIAIWEGHKYTKEEARAASGIETILWTSEYNKVLDLLMHHSSEVYVNMNENDRYVSDVEYRDLRFARQLKNKYPAHTYHRSGPLMANIRVCKESEEIQQMKEAISITEKAFRGVLSFVKPGVKEYEIEAIISHEFLRNRATGHAYSPIIASGKNACVLHYVDNNQKCNDGEIILMDFGAEYGNYAADLSRSIPVNGKFTKRQKDVYNAVHRVMKAATKMLIKGNTLEKYEKEVGQIMTEELIGLKLLDRGAVKKQNPELPLYKKYFMHGTSHFLGLDVHDIGNRYEPMKSGMVFTVEPGIYIPEENLGIRLENNILITEKSNTDLMASIPVDADEIEKLMK
ncbi:MAG TPA: aminopeptidase P family protein [Bacteroidia bacterium]|nr:aminopeptidase P family protein [Bacteroidia bacterium]HNT79226.1 aminopeptidase P family protein [Bacteroidia bacterium]